MQELLILPPQDLHLEGLWGPGMIQKPGAFHPEGLWRPLTSISKTSIPKDFEVLGWSRTLGPFIPRDFEGPSQASPRPPSRRTLRSWDDPEPWGLSSRGTLKAPHKHLQDLHLEGLWGPGMIQKPGAFHPEGLWTPSQASPRPPSRRTLRSWDDPEPWGLPSRGTLKLSKVSMFYIFRPRFSIYALILVPWMTRTFLWVCFFC